MNIFIKLKKFFNIFLLIILLILIIFIIKQNRREIEKEFVVVEIKNYFKPIPKYYGKKEIKKTVLGIVLTNQKNILQRGVAVWDTWGHEFEDIVFVCNCPLIIAIKNLLSINATIPKELEIYKTILNLPILHIESPESRDRMGEKVLVVVRESYKIYSNYSNWYYIVDDDAFVFVHNLYKFIDNKNSSEPYIYGFKFHHLPKPGGHIGGGPGILLTNESMSRLVDKVNKNECGPYTDTYGDVTVAWCSYQNGVRIAYSNDDKGRPYWHFYDPKTHFYGPIPEFLYSYGVHDKKIGKECCSMNTIAFHYVKTNEMYEIYSNKNFLKEMLS